MSATARALQEFEKATGRPWKESITEMANRGYTWADVAEIIGCPTNNLKQWCHSRGIRFPWQGHLSPIMRQHQSRTLKGRKIGTQAHYERFTAFGVTASLPKLAEQFGHLENVTYDTLYRRVRVHGMDPETALTTPLMSLHERGVLGNRARNRRSRDDHPWRKDNGGFTTAST